MRFPFALIIGWVAIPTALIVGAVGPAAAQSGAATRGGGDGDSRVDARECLVVRESLEMLAVIYEEIGDMLNSETLKRQAVDTAAVVATLSCEDLLDIYPAAATLDGWIDQALSVRELLDRGAEPNLGPETQAALLGAQYSPIGNVRPGSELQVAVHHLLSTARLMHSVSSRHCQQLTVIGGEGSNTPRACLVADSLLTMTEDLRDALGLARDDVDSAEIRGTYERVGHLHGQLGGLGAQVASVGVTANQIRSQTGYLDMQHEGLGEQMTGLRNGVDSLGGRVDALSADLAALDGEVTSIGEGVDALGEIPEDLEGLTETIGALDGRVSSLAADLASLEANVEAMRLANCEIIRLLLTPPGERTTDCPTCGDVLSLPMEWSDQD